MWQISLGFQILECIQHIFDKFTPPRVWCIKNLLLSGCSFEQQKGALFVIVWTSSLNKIKLSCKITFLSITVYTRAFTGINILVGVYVGGIVLYFFIFLHTEMTSLFWGTKLSVNQALLSTAFSWGQGFQGIIEGESFLKTYLCGVGMGGSNLLVFILLRAIISLKTLLAGYHCRKRLLPATLLFSMRNTVPWESTFSLYFCGKHQEKKNSKSRETKQLETTPEALLFV